MYCLNRELLNLPDDEKRMEVFDKHKFLVQAKEINESDFSRLKASKDPSDEVNFASGVLHIFLDKLSFFRSANFGNKEKLTIALN